MKLWGAIFVAKHSLPYIWYNMCRVNEKSEISLRLMNGARDCPDDPASMMKTVKIRFDLFLYNLSTLLYENHTEKADPAVSARDGERKVSALKKSTRVCARACVGAMHVHQNFTSFIFWSALA